MLRRKFGCLGVLILSLVLYKLLYFDVNVVDLCEVYKKPFIFGLDACPCILKGGITVEHGFLSKVVATFGPKAVIRASLNGNKIMLKTLGTAQEFKSLEAKAKEIFYTDVSGISLPHIKDEILKALHPPLKNIVPKLYLCPKPNNTNTFLSTVFNGYESLDTDNLLNIWTSIMINPEPLMLQILKPPAYPMPTYYGSCGRLGVFEDCGERMTLFYDAPWLLRANVTLQVLSAAYELTFGHPTFAFYLTDISPDNIAVNEEGKARFIDLENVIVLDKNPIPVDGLPCWSQNHTSEVGDCTDCFSFSMDEICSHKISDHNIYGVCKEILSNSYLLPGGFLHGPPKEVLAAFPDLQILISECVEPTGKGRFEVAHKFMDILVKTMS